jgi:peptidyl-prolyl cis-trans isomerase C
MTHKTATLLTLTLLAALFAAPGTFAVSSGTNATAKPADKLTELFGDAVIAKGKGVEVKRSQLDSALISIKSAAAARGQSIPPEQVQMLERQQLQGLIQIQLLLGKATEADKVKGKEAAEKQFALIVKRTGSEEALNRQLKSVGMTEADLRAKISDTAIAQAVLDRELKVTVTDGDVKKFYDENPARFEEPEMVRASHILLSTLDSARQPLSDDKKAAKRKQAEDLLKRARAGEDFAKLAREFSEDPGSKEKGGEYTFPRGAMVPEFESAAFSLNTNQISDIVTTQFGYHIIKLSEKIPAHQVTLAKVADDLKEGLKRRETEKLLPDYIEKLKQACNVEILDEKLKPKEVTPGIAVEPAKPEKTVEKKTDAKK